MHIVIIPSWYQAAEEGHVGIFIRDIAENYSLAGHQVSVISFHVDKDKVEKTITIECEGFTEYYHYVNKRSQIRKKSFFYLEQYVSQYGRPDIINTHGLSALGWIRKIKAKYKMPIIHTEHLSSLMENRLSIKLRLQTFFYYRRASHIIAVSRALAAHIIKLTSSPVSFISGMVHQDFFSRVLKDAANTKVTMACVSDLDPRKGHILLLEALNILKKREMDFNLHLIGDGPEKENLLSYVNEHSLTDEVIFHGRMGREEVINVLENCALYVTASKLESFGSHIAEGLAMGLYVVATDCKSPEFYINEENGVIVHEFDAVSLADAIELAILEHEVLSKNSIRASIKEIASPKVVIPQIEDIFEQYLA